jgi:hypothetical protein
MAENPFRNESRRHLAAIGRADDRDGHRVPVVIAAA